MQRAEKIFTILALVSLVAAFFYPVFFGEDSGDLPLVQSALPEASEFAKVSVDPTVYQAFAVQGGQRVLLGYVGLGSASGYEGKVVTAVVADPQGTITAVKVVQHTEWLTWFQKVVSLGFLENFAGRKVNDPLTLGSDLDAVSSATFTSRGIAEGVRQAAHSIAKTQLGLPVPPTALDLKLDAKVILVLAIWAVVIAGVLLKQNSLRWVTLIVSVGGIGFWLAAPLSFSSLAALLLGRFPPLTTSYLVWYLLVAGVVATILVFGRNLYCYWVCPFGGLHDLLATAGGGGFAPTRRVSRLLRMARPLLTWGALVIIFVTRKPSAGGFEPFGTLFSFTGTNVAWVLLVFVLVMGILSKRFWCLNLCPVGYTVDLLASWRRKVAKLLRRREAEETA